MTALTCPECGFTAVDPRGLGAHRRKRHGVVGTSRRAKRRATTTTPESAPRPTRTRHEPARRLTFPCNAPGCDREFASEQAIGAHRRNAHGPKPPTTVTLELGVAELPLVRAALRETAAVRDRIAAGDSRRESQADTARVLRDVALRVERLEPVK